MKNKLKELLNKLSDSYYCDSKSLVTDKEFDLLVKKYEELFNTPYRYLGKTDNRLIKRTHKHPMLSLNKVNTIDDLKKWLNKIKYSCILDLKLDGVSLDLTYVYGYLTQGVTRGNGLEGEDVTHNLINIKNIPNYIEDFKDVEYIGIRGEVVISKKNFIKMKEANPEFTAARNLASGSLRQKNPSESSNRNLNFIAYFILDEHRAECNYSVMNGKLTSYGFKTSPYELLDGQKIEDVVAKFALIRNTYEYECDGLVIKICNKMIASQLGSNDHHPHWAVAFKFQAQSEWSILERIEWNVGGTGRVSPIAIVSPVVVCDCTITKISLHNLDFIKNLDLKINDNVLVERAGDVIPYLKYSTHAESSKDIEIPEYCPDCGSKLVIDNQFIFCENEDCESIVTGKILKFAGILNIKGIGDVIALNIAKAMIARGAKYYQLLSSTEESLSRVANSNVLGKKIYLELQKAKENFTAEKALAALFIDGISVSNGTKILQKIDYNQLSDVSVATFTTIDGVGSVLASNLRHGLINNKAYEFFKQFIKAPASAIIVTGGSLSGKNVCATGVLPVGRKEIEKMISDNGGNVKDTVTGSLDFLIVGEKAGSKLQKAQKLNITIIDYEEFLDMLK